jgi:hypothetical protein
MEISILFGNYLDSNALKIELIKLEERILNMNKIETKEI